MSLFLPEQKLGSHSSEGGSSNKFILKGRQTGTMHRGHTWVFRAESHDTMMAWYEDIKALTEKTPEERSQFVRHHSRSLSQSSRRSASSDGIVDEDDEEPFSADSQIDVNPVPRPDTASRRAQPGGRFPSDIQVNAQRGLQANRSPSSLSSAGQPEHPSPDAQVIAAAGALPGSDVQPVSYGPDQERQGGYGELGQTSVDVPSKAAIADQVAQHDGVNPYTSEPMSDAHFQKEQTTIIAPVIVPDTKQHELQTTQPHTDGKGSEVANEGNYSVSTDYFSSARNRDIQMANAHDPNDVGTPSTTLTESTFAPPGHGDDSQPSRPKNSTRNDSVNTISNLHIPGGFPKTMA